NEAQAASPLVASMLDAQYHYAEHLIQDQNWLLGKNADAWFAANLDPKTLQQTVLKAIDQDLAFAQTLKDVLNTTSGAISHDTVTWSFKTSKLPEALQGAKTIVEDWTSFMAVVQGRYPDALQPHLTDFVFLGQTEVLGTSQT